MKSKHIGIAAMLMLMSSLLGAAGFAVYRLQFCEVPLVITAPPALPQINVPTPDEIRTMAQLMPKLAQLPNPNGSIQGSVALEPFGYRRPVVGSGQENDDSETSNGHLKYELTFTFSSGPRRFCIIDGNFYPQGGELPDGAKIEKIEVHKVLIRRDARYAWIPLAAPAVTQETQSSSRKPSRKTDMEGKGAS